MKKERSLFKKRNHIKESKQKGGIKKTKIDDGFSSRGHAYTMNYGEKARGKKLTKRTQRKLKKGNKSHDAFASASNLNKNAPSNSSKGQRARQKTKKKKIFRFLHLKSKEDRQMWKTSSGGRDEFAPSRKERKAMRNQKKKKMYGLGLP